MILPGQPSYSWPPPYTPVWARTVAGEPLAIDLATVKNFINRPLEDTFWDVELTRFIVAAQKAIEKIAQLTLVSSTWVGSFAGFYDQIRINKRPFQAVTKIEYVAPTTGAITTVDAATYHALPIAQQCGMVFLGDGLEWPTPARRLDAVRITARVGFDPLPEEVEHALLMTVAALDRKRGDDGQVNANVSVYAQRNAGGTSIVPAEARALIGDHILRTI